MVAESAMVYLNCALRCICLTHPAQRYPKGVVKACRWYGHHFKVDLNKHILKLIPVFDLKVPDANPFMSRVDEHYISVVYKMHLSGNSNNKKQIPLTIYLN